MALSNHFNQKLFIAEVIYKGWRAENATTYKTRDAFQKRKKKISVTRPGKCYHIQDRRIPKKYFKIKIQKKINQYIYIYDKT